MIDFLGFIPITVAPSDLNASDVLYLAIVEPDLITIAAHYSSEDSDPVILTMSCFLDVEEAYVSLEQDTTGTRLMIDNIEVYCSTNMNRCSYTWLKDSTLYNISGSIEQERCLTIVEKLIGGNP